MLESWCSDCGFISNMHDCGWPHEGDEDDLRMNNPNKIKKICIDYDNTLAHSFYADNESHADRILDTYSEYWRGEKFQIIPTGWDMSPPKWFVTFKRSWADELIKFSKDLVGADNVYILTAASNDYILHCNSVLELGFDPNTHIFSREHMYEINKHSKFLESHNVLVDDLPYREHLGKTSHKVEFLNMLPEAQYVQVKYFTVWSETLDDDTEYLEDLKIRIEKALN